MLQLPTIYKMIIVNKLNQKYTSIGVAGGKAFKTKLK
jgi:hypothetical protein